MFYSWPTVHVYVSKFVSMGLFYRPLAAKTPIFAVFWFWHLVMSTVGGNLKKLNTGAQLQTFLYPTASKSFLYSNAFMAKAGEQTLTFKSVTDRQNKTQRFSPPGRRVKSELHQNWHGDRRPRTRSCISKIFGVWLIVTPLRSTETFGVTRPSQIKTPITP